MGTINFDNLNGEKSYQAHKFYSNSKLACLLLSYRLAEQLEGTGVNLNSLHPGFVATDIARKYSATNTLVHLFGKSPEQGAKTQLFLAMSPTVEKVNGKYFIDSKETQSSSKSYDKQLAEKLWEYYTKVTIPNEDTTKIDNEETLLG